MLGSRLASVLGRSLQTPLMVFRFPKARHLSFYYATPRNNPLLTPRIWSPRPPLHITSIYSPPYRRWLSTTQSANAQAKTDEQQAQQQEQQQQQEQSQAQTEKTQQETEEQFPEQEEPAFRKERQKTSFFRPQPQVELPKRISRGVAWLYFAVGALALFVAARELWKMRTNFRESTVDIYLIVKSIIEQTAMQVVSDDRVMKTLGPVFIDDPMVTFQIFGDRLTVTYPIVQQLTGARGGTVYIDMKREEDTYLIASAYIDFVGGTHIDLQLPEDFKFFIYDPKYSVEEAVKQMALEEERVRKQREQEIQQRQQQRQAQQLFQPARK